MEAIALKCLLAGSDTRLGLMGRAGLAGLAKQVERIQGEDSLSDQAVAGALLPTTLPDIVPRTLLSIVPGTLLNISPGTILVLGPTTIAGLASEPGKKRRRFFETLLAAGVSGLALGGVSDLPKYLVCLAEQTSIFVFCSRFDENLLVSRLSGLLQEKLHRRLFVQGALVNVGGRGVLITGISGAGKTTLALELARRGHKWIADDAVEINKKPDGRLYGRSQARVKNLIEIKGIGVLNVNDLLTAAYVADETPLDLIVELGGSSEGRPYWGRKSRIIMGSRVPRYKIPCLNDRAGQLEKAIKIISPTE